MDQLRPFKVSALVAALIAAVSGPVVAQDTETGFQLLNEIFEVSNAVESDEPETARNAYKICTGLGKELEGLDGLEAGVRLYLEAEIEGCLSYAMYHGDFSDETGDKCSHHYAHAEKLKDAILAAQSKPGVRQEQLTNLRESLQRASEVGPQHYECASDYAKLLASLPATDAIAPAD